MGKGREWMFGLIMFGFVFEDEIESEFHCVSVFLERERE